MTITDKDPGRTDLLGTALVDAVQRTGASVGCLYLRSDADPVLHLAVLCGLPPELFAPWTQVPLAAPVPVADAVRDDRLVWVGTQEELVRNYPRTAVALPYRFALAATPLEGEGRCWGALLLMWPPSHPGQLTDRQRGRITSSGRRIARHLDETPIWPEGEPAARGEGPRLVEVPAAQRNTTGRAAEDFAERLPGGSVSLDLEGRITFLTSGAAELLGRDADRLLGTLPWHALPWLDDPAYEDHYRSAVISREPCSYLALRPPDHWLRFELHPDPSGISVRITPAPIREEAPRRLDPPLSTDAARSGAGRLYQVMHLAAALTETTGVRDVVDMIGDQIMPAFGAQGLMLARVDGGRLRIIGSRGYGPYILERLDGQPLDTTLTPAGDVLMASTPMFFDSPEDLARSYPDAPTTSDKRAWAFLPLNFTGQVAGCCVLSYDRPRPFTADERAVLTSLAGLIAQALDRARLYDAKKNLAHGLQEALLPRRLPAVDGLGIGARYLPASHGMDIGGDFYDVICRARKLCSAVIGDVQGHNVAAAALMGQVRTAVHAHSTAGTPPGEVLVRTNRLLDDLHADLLVSCLCVHLDLARHCANIASAGHPPPLLRGPDGHTEIAPVEPGPLLGVTPDAEYPVTHVDFGPGTLIALYTDGLIEDPGCDFGDSLDIVARCLTDADEAELADLPALIDTLVRKSRPTGHHTDDIALLLLHAAPE